jgi:multidrug resistance efflux pump
MFRKYLLPALAVVGFLYAVYSVKSTNEAPPVQPPVVAPSQSPFSTFIFGAGVIEANTENIAVGAPVAGIVTKVSVKVGARVRAGDPLLLLDDRELRAALAARKARLATARARQDRLVAFPRPEEVAISEARRAEAAAHTTEMEIRRARTKGVDPRAVSAEEMTQRTSAAAMAQAKLAQAEADLALLRAGSWMPDRTLARAEVAAAEAEVAEIQTAIERLTVRAPGDGEVLRVNVRVGEFASQREQGLILLGHTDPLAVRVDIDEHDAWRFQAGTEATAFVRGNPQIKIPLTFSHLEPMLTPKRSLTGESTERVDTRVLQAIYHFDRGVLPVYIGQQVDVHIATPNNSEGYAETPRRGGETGEKP